MSILHLMNTTADVYTVTETQDNAGGLVEAEVIKHSNAPCLIEIARPSFERELVGRDGVEITHYIYFPSGYTDIVEKDRIKSGSRVYDVQTVDDVQGRDHHLEVYAVVRE